jgi:hypothetical protein
MFVVNGGYFAFIPLGVSMHTTNVNYYIFIGMNNVFEPEVKREMRAFDLPSLFFLCLSLKFLDTAAQERDDTACTVTCTNCLVQE